MAQILEHFDTPLAEQGRLLAVQRELSEWAQLGEPMPGIALPALSRTRRKTRPSFAPDFVPDLAGAALPSAVFYAMPTAISATMPAPAMRTFFPESGSAPSFFHALPTPGMRPVLSQIPENIPASQTAQTVSLQGRSQTVPEFSMISELPQLSTDVPFVRPAVPVMTDIPAMPEISHSRAPVTDIRTPLAVQTTTHSQPERVENLLAPSLTRFAMPSLEVPRTWAPVAIALPQDLKQQNLKQRNEVHEQTAMHAAGALRTERDISARDVQHTAMPQLFIRESTAHKAVDSIRPEQFQYPALNGRAVLPVVPSINAALPVAPVMNSALPSLNMSGQTFVAPRLFAERGRSDDFVMHSAAASGVNLTVNSGIRSGGNLVAHAVDTSASMHTPRLADNLPRPVFAQIPRPGLSAARAFNADPNIPTAAMPFVPTHPSLSRLVAPASLSSVPVLPSALPPTVPPALSAPFNSSSETQSMPPLSIRDFPASPALESKTRAELTVMPSFAIPALSKKQESARERMNGLPGATDPMQGQPGSGLSGLSASERASALLPTSSADALTIHIDTLNLPQVRDSMDFTQALRLLVSEYEVADEYFERG